MEALVETKTFRRSLAETRFDKNEIIIEGEISRILLKNMKKEVVGEAILDTEDLPKVSSFKWHLSYGYAVKNEKPIFLHQLLLKVKEGQRVDHKDHNKLNNRKDNLRSSTAGQNAINGVVRQDNPSGYRGVYFEGKSWIAKITVAGKPIRLGKFSDKETAFSAYLAAVKEYFGEFVAENLYKNKSKEIISLRGGIKT